MLSKQLDLSSLVKVKIPAHAHGNEQSNLSLIFRNLAKTSDEQCDQIKDIIVRESTLEMELSELVEKRNKELTQIRQMYKDLAERLEDTKRVFSGFKLTVRKISFTISDLMETMDKFNSDYIQSAGVTQQLDSLANLIESYQGDKKLAGSLNMKVVFPKSVFAKISDDIVHSEDKPKKHQQLSLKDLDSSVELDHEGYVKLERNFLDNKAHSYAFDDRLALTQGVKCSLLLT